MKQFNRLPSTDGFCSAYAVDCVIEPDLPNGIYTLAHDLYHSQSIEDTHGAFFGAVLSEVLGVTPVMDQAHAPLATFNAFSADPQSYFTDSRYTFPEQHDAWSSVGIPNIDTVLRLKDLIGRAREADCGIMYYTDTISGPHTLALEHVTAANPRFLVRNNAQLASDHIYTPEELSGLAAYYPQPHTFKDSFAPIPHTEAPYFPQGKTSWELIIIPRNPA